MDRCADAAAIGVKKPDESLPAPASHSGSAETVSGSGWRCWQEADILRSGRSPDPSDDSPGAPFVDRSPDAPSPFFVKSRIDRVRDDAVGPEKLVFNWRKASSYGPRARRGLRRTLSSVLCGRLFDRAQDHVAPVDGQAIDDLVAHVPPATGRAPRAHRAVSAAPAGEVRTGGWRERVRDRALRSVDRALDGSRGRVARCGGLGRRRSRRGGCPKATNDGAGDPAAGRGRWRRIGALGRSGQRGGCETAEALAAWPVLRAARKRGTRLDSEREGGAGSALVAPGARQGAIDLAGTECGSGQGPSSL